ncbi:MAG TPA: HAMP domain-containing sensor histidine kinase [Polyangiaceae bacterium]
MLTQFIATHRDSIARRARCIVQERPAPAPSQEELDGLPVFIDQLSEQLLRRQGMLSEAGPDIGATASRRGERLQRLGVSLAQVVHDYGSVCQAIMDVAHGEGATIAVDEYKTLNRCLDEAIAEAITRHGAVGAEERELTRDRQEAEHVGVLVHELRNALGAVFLAYQSMKRSNVSPCGSRTGAIIERSLQRLADLIDRSLSEVRLQAAPEPRPETFSLGDLIDEIEGPAAATAQARELRLTMRADPPDASLTADRQLVVSALSNLVQNAIKFTRPRGVVAVRLRAESDSVVFEVEDECGGLPPGAAERLFQPFVRAAHDAAGVGLGLAIVRRAVEAHGGTVRVLDKPGVGCMFTIRLPR